MKEKNIHKRLKDGTEVWTPQTQEHKDIKKEILSYSKEEIYEMYMFLSKKKILYLCKYYM